MNKNYTDPSGLTSLQVKSDGTLFTYFNIGSKHNFEYVHLDKVQVSKIVCQLSKWLIETQDIDVIELINMNVLEEF